MYCEQCGRKLSENEICYCMLPEDERPVFCEFCGTKLDAEGRCSCAEYLTAYGPAIVNIETPLFCEYCGSKLDENGNCGCEDYLVAYGLNSTPENACITEEAMREGEFTVEQFEPLTTDTTPVIPVEQESITPKKKGIDTATVTNVLDALKHNKKKVGIGAGVLIATIIAIVLIFPLGNSKEDPYYGGDDYTPAVHNLAEIRLQAEEDVSSRYMVEDLEIVEVYYGELRYDEESVYEPYERIIRVSYEGTYEGDEYWFGSIDYEVEAMNMDDSTFTLTGESIISYDSNEYGSAFEWTEEVSYSFAELLDEGNPLDTALLKLSEFGQSVIRQYEGIHDMFIEHAKSCLEEQANFGDSEDIRYEFESLVYTEDDASEYYGLFVVFKAYNHPGKVLYKAVEYSNNTHGTSALYFNSSWLLDNPYEESSIVSFEKEDYLLQIQSSGAHFGYELTEPYVIRKTENIEETSSSDNSAVVYEPTGSEILSLPTKEFNVLAEYAIDTLENENEEISVTDSEFEAKAMYYSEEDCSIMFHAEYIESYSGNPMYACVVFDQIIIVDGHLRTREQYDSNPDEMKFDVYPNFAFDPEYLQPEYFEDTHYSLPYTVE